MKSGGVMQNLHPLAPSSTLLIHPTLAPSHILSWQVRGTIDRERDERTDHLCVSWGSSRDPASQLESNQGSRLSWDRSRGVSMHAASRHCTLLPHSAVRSGRGGALHLLIYRSYHNFPTVAFHSARQWGAWADGRALASCGRVGWGGQIKGEHGFPYMAGMSSLCDTCSASPMRGLPQPACSPSWTQTSSHLRTCSTSSSRCLDPTYFPPADLQHKLKRVPRSHLVSACGLAAQAQAGSSVILTVVL